MCSELIRILTKKLEKYSTCVRINVLLVLLNPLSVSDMTKA